MNNLLPNNWREIRQKILTRDSNQCVVCGEKEFLQVHHIHPKYFGGSHEPSNLITLCNKCHTDQHIDLQIKLGKKAIIKISHFFKKLISDYNKQPLSDSKYILLLKQLTGGTNFRAGQEKIINEVLKGKDVLVIRPTGGGKSLCFQLPALVNKNQSLIISPLKTLMRDQVQALQKRWIPATFLNSDLTQEELNGRVEFLKYNYFKLFYLAPERFSSTNITTQELYHIPIGIFIVDEAHCIVKWGNDFRPDYNNLGNVKTKLNNPQTLAFTATANERARNEIISKLKLRNPTVFIQGFNRPNITLFVDKIASKRTSRFYNEYNKKIDSLKNILYQIKGKTIVFVPTIKVGESVLEGLKEFYVGNLELFHAKLDTLIKNNIQDRFCGKLKPELNILISTSAFAMGVDIPNIRCIVHWTQPSSIDEYFQEIGRAGRDGKPSLAILMKFYKDHSINQFMINKTVENIEELSERYKIKSNKYEDLNAMTSYIYSYECRRKYILNYFGEVLKNKNRFLIFLKNIFSRKKYYCCDNCNSRTTENKIIKRINTYC